MYKTLGVGQSFHKHHVIAFSISLSIFFSLELRRGAACHFIKVDKKINDSYHYPCWFFVVVVVFGF